MFIDSAWAYKICVTGSNCIWRIGGCWLEKRKLIMHSSSIAVKFFSIMIYNLSLSQPVKSANEA